MAALGRDFLLCRHTSQQGSRPLKCSPCFCLVQYWMYVTHIHECGDPGPRLHVAPTTPPLSYQTDQPRLLAQTAWGLVL